MITAAIVYAISGPKADPVTDEGLPSVENEPLEPTSLDEFKNIFGPFETIVIDTNSATPDTHDPAMLILNQDGSTQASQSWTVTFSADSWDVATTPLEIGSMTVQMDTVFIGTNDRTFVVKANQPFIFEERPETVYAVDAQGQIWSVTTAWAENSRNELAE